MMDKRLSILLVDDDEEDIFLTSRVLSKIQGFHCHVDAVDSYDAGCQKLENADHYDICFFDYHINGKTGLELLHYAIKSGYSKPIIILTGQTGVELENQLIKAGASDYIHKGKISTETLERSIRYAIGRHQAAKDFRASNDCLSLLLEISKLISDESTFEESLEQCIKRICRILDWPIGHVYMADEQNPSKLIPTDIWYQAEPEMCQALESITCKSTFEYGQDFIGRIWETGQPIWIRDVMEEPGFLRKNLVNDIGICGALGIPVIINDQVVAVLEFFSHQPEEPNENLLALLENAGKLLSRLFERQLAEKLRQRLAFIVESSQDAIIGLSLEGVITEWNKAAELMYGYSAQEAIGQPSTLVILPEHYQESKTVIRRVLRDEKVDHFETTHSDKSGKPLNVLLQASPIRNETGDIIGTSLIARDITEKKALERQLIQMQKMESIGQLAAGVAHEINNPIGYVTGNVGMLTKYVASFKSLIESYQKLAQSLNGNATSEQKALLESIEAFRKKKNMAFVWDDVDNMMLESKDGLDRVKEIVQGLKNFARVDDENLVATDLNTCIENTLKLVWNELKYKCEVHKHFGELPPVNANAGKLSQVFTNILINAAHAIETHGQITIETKLDDNFAVVRISDTGCGIDPEYLNKITDPFFTTKPEGQGTGLGLSISQNIVHEHGGFFEVESTPGEGSTFTIKLPVNGLVPEIKPNAK